MKKTFNIQKNIYKIKNIKQAIKDFEEVAKIKYNISLEELIVEWEENKEIEEVFNELMNYIISLECN